MMHERRCLRRLLGVAVGMAMTLCVLYWGAAPTEAKSNHGSESQKHDSALEGKPAPEFVLSDIYGIPRRLSGWRGMPIVLNFGSSW